MSQIGNKIRMGFYATPDQQTAHIKQLLDFTGDCSVFDPTCGSGKALYDLTVDQEHHIHTYGVELDKTRAEKASELLDTVVAAPIESMVISHNQFGCVFLNPPYDSYLKGDDGEETSRKEFEELKRNVKYLQKGGVLIYIIPSYRMAHPSIARFLATNFQKGEIGVFRFSDEDYEDYKQLVFIGRKKQAGLKSLNNPLYEFLQQLEDEEVVYSKVTSLSHVVGKNTWKVPSGPTEIPTFYTRLEQKGHYISSIQDSKGFQAFKERAKPKQLVLGGQPIINIAQGQMALLLASGAINGLIGFGKNLHVVQGIEIVSTDREEELLEHDSGSVTKKSVARTNRKVSVKVITPKGVIIKLV